MLIVQLSLIIMENLFYHTNYPLILLVRLNYNIASFSLANFTGTGLVYIKQMLISETEH